MTSKLVACWAFKRPTLMKLPVKVVQLSVELNTRLSDTIGVRYSSIINVAEYLSQNESQRSAILMTRNNPGSLAKWKADEVVRPRDWHTEY